MTHLQTNCLACNSPNSIFFLDSNKRFFHCINCDSIYAKSTIENPTISVTMNSYVKSKFIIKLADINTMFYIKYLKEKTSFHFKNALDIGTRFGTFVKQLNDENINAYGIEPNKHLERYAVTKKIMWNTFDYNYFKDKKYDLICLPSVIFYLRDNITILKQIKNILTPDGILFIVTMNPSSTLIKNNLLRLNEENSQMIFSKKIFESFEKSIGLKLLDYTTVMSNFYNELDNSKNKLFTFMKFFLKYKKAYTEDPNGNHSFILLSNVSRD